jgi:FtsZ-binding cell division protein ZapB
MKLTRQQILLATSVVLLVGGGIFSAITVSDLTEQLGILEDSYENLQSDYESLELKHQRLQTSNDELQAEYESLRTDHDTLQVRFTELLSNLGDSYIDVVCGNTEPFVELWLEANIDDISEMVGGLITLNMPIAKDIAAKVVEQALMSYLEWDIVNTALSPDNQTCIKTVRLTFPIKMDLAQLSMQYGVQVDYLLRIRENRVIDSDIDLESFNMK